MIKGKSILLAGVMVGGLSALSHAEIQPIDKGSIDAKSTSIAVKSVSSISRDLGSLKLQSTTGTPFSSYLLLGNINLDAFPRRYVDVMGMKLAGITLLVGGHVTTLDKYGAKEDRGRISLNLLYKDPVIGLSLGGAAIYLLGKIIEVMRPSKYAPLSSPQRHETYKNFHREGLLSSLFLNPVIESLEEGGYVLGIEIEKHF